MSICSHALEAIGDPKITEINVTGFWTSRRTPIFGETNGTLIVLVKGSTGDGITLSAKEIQGPDNVRKVITGTNQFCLGGTLRIEFLFGGAAGETANAKGHQSTSVAAHIGVNPV